MQIVPADLNIDFLGKRKIAAVFSGIVITFAFVLFVTRGIELGIDFSGGVELQVRVTEPVPIADVREALKGTDVGASVQAFGDVPDTEYLVRAPLSDEIDAKTEADRIRNALESTFSEQGVNIVRVEVVGPKVGQELREKGLASIIFALAGILLYVWFRFELQYAFGAIAALVHDVTVVVGLFSLLGIEFNLPTIAALLTIIGYSLNDTVVVFDRIRENRNRSRRGPFLPVINRSINETLSRTLLTRITTLITVIALLVFTQPGSVIHDFAIALLAGVLVGTYSSVFIASSVLLLREKR